MFLWGADITAETAQAWGRALVRELAAAPRCATLVWLTGLPRSVPREEVREKMARVIAHAPPTFVGLHYLVEGEGFGSSVAQSVVTGLNLRARAALATSVHTDLAAVTRVLAKDLEWTTPDAEAFARGAQLLRREWAGVGGTPLPLSAGAPQRGP